MLKNDIEQLYEETKLRDFEHKHDMSKLKKGTIVKRVNSRLYKMLERKQDTPPSKDEINLFIEKQLAKLDTPSKPQKARKENNGPFRTEWGEDIYRKNAFLGAEVNSMSEYAKVNRKLMTYIKNREKVNKPPSEQEVDNIMEKFLSELDKKGLDEAKVLRRKSLPHILETLYERAEPNSMPYFDEELERSATLVMLKVDASHLSYAEARILKDIFEFEDDPTQNLIFITIGVVDAPPESIEARYAEEISIKDAANTVIEETKNDLIYDQSEVDAIMNKIENGLNDSVNELKAENNEIVEVNKKLKKKERYLNVLIGFMILFILGYMYYIY